MHTVNVAYTPFPILDRLDGRRGFGDEFWEILNREPCSQMHLKTASGLSEGTSIAD